MQKGPSPGGVGGVSQAESHARRRCIGIGATAERARWDALDVQGHREAPDFNATIADFVNAAALSAAVGAHP